jgi:hypothetical protein
MAYVLSKLHFSHAGFMIFVNVIIDVNQFIIFYNGCILDKIVHNIIIKEG